MKKMNKCLTLLMSAMLLCTMAWAQGDKASRPSPPATATGKINDANITISYNSPSVKGRKVWGGLVPYGQVWRAGANEATIFETDKNITVEGKSLPAGKYSLYAMPGENEWIIMFNSEIGQWGVKRTGETSRDAGKDVLSVQVKPRKSTNMHEQLVYEVANDGFVIKWDNLKVPVLVK